MIYRPLREDMRHAAAAVVRMRDAYRSFEAEEVGQNTLNWAYVKVKASTIGSASKASPAPLPQTLGHPQAFTVIGAVVCRQKGPPPEALAKQA